MRKIVLALAFGLAVSAAPAAAMNVSEFLTRASALEKKGVAALFSKDFTLLKEEVKSAGVALRRDQLAAQGAGRRPVACLPGDKVPVRSDELLSYFRSIPPAQRNMSVSAAFAAMMKKKYPCPA